MNKLFTAVLITFLSAIAVSAVSAQDRDDPTPLLRNEADIHVAEPGLCRIPISAEVLSEASAGLSDVRILDASGEEVPWILAGTVPPRPRTEAITLTPLEATRDRRRRVYDRYGRYETFVIALPDAPIGTDGWDLEVSSALGNFTRNYRVERVVDGMRGNELSRGTLFRFGEPAREKRRIPLGARSGTFRVMIDGDDYAWLAPTFSAVAARPSDNVPTVALPLTITSRQSSGDETTLVVTRPRGVVPSLLRIETTSSTFLRRIAVRDRGFGSESRSIGGATTFRVADPVGAERLDVPLTPARGDTLEIVITNDDAPPLNDLAVVAILRQPVLVADLRGDATLRFGGGRLRAPRYDLSRLSTSELGHRLVEADLPLATLGPVRPNAAFDAAPALAWAMRAGAPVDEFRYRHRRDVFLDPSEEGLSRIRLGADDLGRMTDDLADLRVVDTTGRQWPFLAQPDAALERVPLAAEATTSRGGSAFAMRFAGGPAPIRAVVVETAAPFVDRDYVLYGHRGEAEDRVIARGRLVRRPHDDPGMRIEVGDERLDHLRLVVRDGADAPLASVTIVAEVPVPDVYVAAPAGDYALLLGATGVESPRYEIQRARDLILSVSPAEAHPRELHENPAFVAPREPLHIQDWILWAVLLLAVVLLSFLTLRALKSETAEIAADDEPDSASNGSAGTNPPENDSGSGAPEPPDPEPHSA